MVSEAAKTSNVTVLDARLPAESMTEYVTSIVPGVSPASRRTWFPVTKGVPTAESRSYSRVDSTCRFRPAGERSFDRTETVPTSPTRTLPLSGFRTGGKSERSVAPGITVTVALALP